jgi:hypothetical protein
MQDQFPKVRLGRPQQRLGAARAVLEMEPDHGQPARLRDLARHLGGAGVAGQREAEGGRDHELRAEEHEVTAAHPVAADVLANRLFVVRRDGWHQAPLVMDW